MKVRSFFVMDENFLLYRKRSLELLNLMKQHDKSWSLYVFSSARVIQTYTVEQLLGLGISWVWMGLEGENSSYAKLKGIDTRRLVGELQSHGIRVLGSSIIGLESHTPGNIDAVIDYAVGHDTDFHQFMLYTPVPGTPLHAKHQQRRTLLTQCEEADNHGQFQFNFRHPHISRTQSGEYLLRAFQLDYAANGPSIMRIARTLLQGWKRHKNHPEQRIRERFRREAGALFLAYGGALWAMRNYFRASSPHLVGKIEALQSAINQEFGLKSRVLAPLSGFVIRMLIWKEERRLARGWTYEPPTFVEVRNWERGPRSFGLPLKGGAPDPSPAVAEGTAANPKQSLAWRWRPKSQP